MAHFAEIDENNIVKRVLVVDNSMEDRGHDFLANDLGLGGTWIQTSYNTSFGVHKYGKEPLRYTYAGIGYIYHPEWDIFHPPCQYKSWTLSVSSTQEGGFSAFGWKPPVQLNADGSFYTWSEPTSSWTCILSMSAFPNLSGADLYRYFQTSLSSTPLTATIYRAEPGEHNFYT